MRQSLIVLLGLVCLSTGAAQAQIIEPTGELVEHMLPAAEISGAVIMGVVVAADRHSNVAGQIGTRIAGDWPAGTELCARVVSSDGRYEAERGFTVPDRWPGGAASLAFPTSHGAELAQFDALEIGVTVSVGPCAVTVGNAVLLPASWNGNAPSGEAIVLVNSFRADETFLVIDEPYMEVDCAPLVSDRRTAFDTRCTLPVTLNGHSVVLTINRFRNGAVQGGDPLTIDLR